jgi:hypothetical protein
LRVSVSCCVLSTNSRAAASNGGASASGQSATALPIAAAAAARTAADVLVSPCSPSSSAATSPPMPSSWNGSWGCTAHSLAKSRRQQWSVRCGSLPPVTRGWCAISSNVAMRSGAAMAGSARVISAAANRAGGTESNGSVGASSAGRSASSRCDTQLRSALSSAFATSLAPLPPPLSATFVAAVACLRTAPLACSSSCISSRAAVSVAPGIACTYEPSRA